MTFEEYINNPTGVKSNAMIEMYREMYTKKLDTIMVRETGKIDYELYKSNKKYYCYMKIPSEVINKFYYDVIIEFSEPKDNKIGDASLRNYDVRFFSNDPAFVYTYTYTFKKKGLFIEDYKSKMSEKALKDKPAEKNPNMVVGYVKSLYFAYLLMKRRDLFSKIKYVRLYSKNNLLKEIMHADEKIEARQQAEADKRNKKKAIAIERKQNRDRDIQNYVNKNIGIVSKVKNIGKKAGTIKTTKTVKRK